MSLTIGVDVGGTKIAAGVVDEKGTILEQDRRPTPSASPADVEQTIADLVTDLRSKHDGVEAIGIAAAGFVDAERATVLFAPNLAWRNEPLRDEVSKLAGLPVVVENDANAAAWGEYRFGAGKGCDHMVCVTVGTGIGGGVVLGGELYRGRYGIGAEFGHMQVVRDGRRCGCGQRGCWEQYCSGRALLHEAREIADVQKDLAKRLLELGGGRSEGIEAPEVTQAAREGDPAALACFQAIGGWLGEGIAMLAATLDPEVFVIGGGVADAGDLLLEPTRAAFLANLTGGTHRPHAAVTLAALANTAGLVERQISRGTAERWPVRAMVATSSARHPRRMTSLDRAAPADVVCCGKPMTSIEVTSALGDRTSTLALQTCGHCGRHVWQRDGVELDRDAVLDVVRDRIAEGPLPRVPRPRKTRPFRVPDDG